MTAFIDKARANTKVFAEKIHFEKWKAWIYLAPALVLLAIFTFWPIFNTIKISFLEGFSIAKSVRGVAFEFGFDNYLLALDDPDFHNCIKNTLLLCFLTVPISTLLALVIAVSLNSIKCLQKFLQTIFFLPYVTNSIAIGMVFAAMFNIMPLGTNYTPEVAESMGVFNFLLDKLGLEPQIWINEGSTYAANIFVMTVYIVWNALPFKILILLGGLQSVNRQYYDAAKIDGTSRFRTFTRITVPLLSPMLAYVIITSFIGGFKEYSSIVGVFGEKMGPLGNYELDTMVGYIYRKIGVIEGTASAAALILFAIIFVVTMINLYVSKKKTHY